jgi:hypothetical protein
MELRRCQPVGLKNHGQISNDLPHQASGSLAMPKLEKCADLCIEIWRRVRVEVCLVEVFLPAFAHIYLHLEISIWLAHF